MQSEGKTPYLTIGPWTHFEAARSGIKDAMIWLRAKMFKQNEKLRENPVKIYIMGANEWREYPIWPPNNMQLTPWYLQSKNGFSTDTPTISEPDSYTYNPADPTPSVGGASTGKPVEDNRTLESRSDVITYTSDTLKSDIELIGPVSAELFIKSSLQYTDFFCESL
jgi:putative CocE/NonD family hydrolase